MTSATTARARAGARTVKAQGARLRHSSRANVDVEYQRHLTFVTWAAVPQDCGAGSAWAVVCSPVHVLEVVLPDYLQGERHSKDVHRPRTCCGVCHGLPNKVDHVSALPAVMHAHHAY